jgi:hypothetical protein
MSYSDKMIVLASITLIVAAGLMALSPSMIGNAQAQMYGDRYGHDNNYNNYYPELKSYHTDVQKIKCINSNINVNGIDITEVPQDGIGVAASNEAATDAVNTENGNGLDRINFDRNLVNVCTNVNSNEQTKITPEEPTPATLTVKKQVFGCSIGSPTSDMRCQFTDNDPAWIQCTDPQISNSEVCQALPANLFDIEVLDDQNNQKAQFEGSEQGTTIQNLEPGTYIVNEIQYERESPTTPNDVLLEGGALATCNARGFDGAGNLYRNPISSNAEYDLCFEYEDEQGNDCSTIALAAGEEKTCIVKNYITFGDI